jgi:hypothetical protein
MTTMTKMIEVDLSLCNLDSHELCRICTYVDELSCSRGKHCAGLMIADRPQPVGYYLDGDDVGRSAYTFKFDGNDEFLFCEDCSYEIEQLEPGAVSDTIVEGNVAELHWMVDMVDGKFQAFVLAYGADHGVIYEDERGVFDTLTEAVEASRGYATTVAELEAREDERMQVEEEHTDAIVELRRFGRLKHPTDLAVPSMLNTMQLDTILFPGDVEDPDPTTVRSILHDVAREAVAEKVAEMLIAGRIPS